MKTNLIYQGDCLRVLRTMPKESVDLIYLDPPFFSKKDYDMPFKDKKSITAFKDSAKSYEEMDIDTINKSLNIQLIHSENDFWKRDKAGLLRYLAYMKDRLKEMYRVLKPTGSIYLHCDWHASHYLKILMDEIFEYKNFRNEIVWCYRTGGATKKHFSRKHDIIFFYTKTKIYNFNCIKERIYYEKAFFNPKKDEDGKYYADVLPVDFWEIPAVINISKERMGYPTQKPEELLKRIILASSNEGDVVLDPNCGCGTAIAVAHKLKRNFIGIDISPIACKVMKERLRKRNNVNIPIIKTDYSLSDINKMGWFEFQGWACDKLKAVPGGKGADRGIDGEGEIKEKSKIIPFLVQVKKWKSNVGDDRVRAFKGAMDNQETPYGIIVANKFSNQAITQANDYFKKKQATILLITTEELLQKDFDVKYRTKWNIIVPDYAPWRKKEVDLSEWEKK